MDRFILALGLALLTAGSPQTEEAPVPPLTVNTGVGAEILRLEDRREWGSELLGFLTSTDRAVRARAAEAAGRIGDPEAIEPLGALLLDVDPSVRSTAAFALGEMEDSVATGPLALLLRSGREQDPMVRAAAIEGLGKLQADDRASLCVAALGDPAREVREAACLASWMMHAAEAVEPLLHLAEDPADELRWKATYALMRMLGAPVSGRTSIPGGTETSSEARERIENALAARVADPDVRIRMTAVRGLRRLEEKPTADAVAAALEDQDWRVRVEAIRSVAAYFEERSATTGISPQAGNLAGSLHDSNPNVRLAALEALGAPGARHDAEKLLHPYLGSPIAREKQVAALSLARLWGSAEEPGSESQDRIRAIAADFAAGEDWRTRAAAAELLQAGGVYDSLLYARLLHDDPRVAKAAVEPYLTERAARRTAGSPVLPALQGDLDPLLASPDPILRAVTIEAVGTILGDSIEAGERENWMRLLRSVWETGRAERGNDIALAILGLIERHTGSATAMEILDDARRASDGLVRKEAVRILRDAGAIESAADAGVIETGRSLQEYASILKWAETDHQVEIVTERGVVRILLFAHEAPLTCWNFAWLSESGFYDGGAWHRVVPDFVVQDGCPRGDGWGGPDHQIRCEINRHRYMTGAVGMALSGKDTGGSQFFITHSPQPHLDGRYTVFGQVVEGQDVVDALVQGDRIESIRLLRTTGIGGRPGER